MSQSNHILEGLNPAQCEAVTTTDRPLLILAGAGSGKTRAITHKIAWLVAEEGFAPWEILAVTFTNKAAQEMRERCEALLGTSAEGLWQGTFHRIGVRILRAHGPLVGVQNNFVIYDSDDQKAMVKRCVEAAGFSKDRYEPKIIQGYINRAKQRALWPAEVASADGLDPKDPWIRIYTHYETSMREANALDFGDLLMLPLKIARDHPIVASEFKQRWRYVLVDEFQDTNRVQYEWLMAVLNDAKRICVVGDDDQSIYRWRGAEVENILGFDRALPDVHVVRLEQNYRCSGHILSCASALIAQNSTRHPKALWTDRAPGELVTVHVAVSDTSEARYIASEISTLKSTLPLREIAILYRTHAQSRVLEDAMRQSALPYSVIGGMRFYERAEVKDILAYLKVLHNPADVISLDRIINTPPRGIGKTTVATIHRTARERSTSTWDAVVRLSKTGTTSQRRRLGAFVDLMQSLTGSAEDSTTAQLTQRILEDTGYLARLRADPSAEALARIENLEELMNAIEDHGERSGDFGLGSYLEQVTLVADIDQAEMGTEDDDRLVMMSTHTAKGLEFDAVFLTGLEHGLFPHFNAIEEVGGVEEERRLAYVAMTRARDRLYLTRAESRRRFGTLQHAIASPFLEGLPSEAIRLDGPTRGQASWSRPQAKSSGLAWSRRPVAPSEEEASDSYDQVMPDYESMSQDPQGMGLGATVFHASFGEGVIIGVDGQGPRAVARVRFGDNKVKRIMARFLTLSF